EVGGSTTLEDLPEPFGLGERRLGTSCPHRVRPDDDGNSCAVPRDGHLLAGHDPVEDLRERRSGLTGGHRRHASIVRSRTLSYNYAGTPRVFVTLCFDSVPETNVRIGWWPWTPSR